MQHSQGICPEHGSVLAVAQTHYVKKAAGVAAGGLPGLVVGRTEAFRCPICGAPVSTAKTRRRAQARARQRELNRRLAGWIPVIGRLYR